MNLRDTERDLPSLSTLMPPMSELRQCLELQAAAPRLSAFSRLFGIDPLARSAVDSYRAASVQLSVVDALDSLGAEWAIIHSVAVGDGIADIEHLAVGPAGVFSVIVRSHAGQRIWVGERTFMADTERFDHIAVAEAQAEAVARLLSLDAGLEPTITPCVVVGQVAALFVGQRSRRVEVITARHFAGWLHSLPRLLSPAAVASLRASASTVATTTRRDSDERDLRADFERLRTKVRLSRMRLLCWVGAGVVVSWMVMFVNCS